MATTPSEKFIANPLKFMKNNLVIVAYGSLIAGQTTLQLRLDQSKTCRTKLGRLWGKRGIPVYTLDHTPGPDHIRCYWLPYQDQKLFHMQLAHECSFMFTPMMDGCSFAFGGQHGLESPLVCHANFQDREGQIDPTRIQTALGLKYGGYGYASMDKADYTASKHFESGSGSVRATTFGVSDGTRWSFYHQKWEDDHRYDKAALMGMSLDYPGGYGAWAAAWRRASTSFELLGVRRI